MHGNQDIHRWTPDSCSRLVEVAGETLRPGGLELTGDLLGYGNVSANSRILDAGCGMGGTTRYLSRSGHLAVVGVDCSESMLQMARSSSKQVPLVCAAVERLPFAAGSFDAVICECVLSQSVVASALAEFQRVLRVDGVLMVSDLYSRASGQEAALEQVAGNRRSTRRQIERMLKEAGFRIERWEDRTRDLRLLAARLIMSPGPVGENLFSWEGAESMCSDQSTKSEHRDLGYYLLVARSVAR